MFRQVLAGFVAAALSLFATAFAAVDVFAVARVPVQATGETATAARDSAQAQGRRVAMDILLRRLTPEEDWSYLPRLASGGAASAAGAPGGKSTVSITPNQLVALESGFEVYGEKSSSSTYRAYITYRFKPDAVRNLLKNARIPYSEAQTRKALVLPVLQTGAGVYLWESNNPWMAAWKARPFTNELTPMAAPLGDLEDSTLINPRQALALDAASLAKVAAHYRVSQVIVAHARLVQQGGNDQVTVRLINGYRETGKALAAQVLDEEDAAVSDAGDAAETFAYQPPDEDFGAQIGETLATVTLSQPSGNFPRLAERAIESSIARYASGWKKRTLIDHSKEILLPVSAFFDSVEDWSRIRTALIATPLIGSVQVVALSRKGAEMDIRVFGEPNRVQIAMENQGIVFWSETGERWFLATPATAGKYKGRRFLRTPQRVGDNEFFDDEEGVENAAATVEDAGGTRSKIDQ